MSHAHQYRLEIAPAESTFMGPDIFVRLHPVKPTEVYETYWRFAALRQDVFFARVEGKAPPWTQDPILRRFKFTNAYRASDRTSQYLIKNVIYRGSTECREQFFRVLLFKLFNRIETWELLEDSFGEVTWRDFDFARYDRVLSEALDREQSIYSAAYIIPSPRGFGHSRKHRNHLRLLEMMMETEIPRQIQDCPRMQDAFELLRSVRSFGDFLAYQFVTDLNYSTLTPFSESEFVIPGPGARDGIRKCFEDLGGLTETDAIKLMADRQSVEFETLGIEFRDLWGRPLQLIDCQNLFCEVDKYARVAHPEVEGISGRTQIKQAYRQSEKPLRVWYPPKWGLNDQIDDAHM